MEPNQVRLVHRPVFVSPSYWYKSTLSASEDLEDEDSTKIKIFLWFLQRGVVLTKENLARKNWKGSQKCVSCNRNENIQHLFLHFPFAKTIWRIIFFATNLNQPISISHLFGTWLNNQPNNMKGLIWVGIAALCWAIWHCRNDVILNKMKTNSIMQVIFKGAYWLRSWS
jgi:hypothetical protein